MWYSKEQMQKLARADIGLLIAQSKTPSSSDDTTGTKICGRGLEMYLSGQLAIRQKRRISYASAILQKQELLKTLCGNDQEEVTEGLRKFSELKSKQCRAEAQALGVQDALDVPKDAIATKTTADLLSSMEASMRAKQMLTMRNACLMRAV